MLVKVLLFGEAVQVPILGAGGGVALVFLWIDGRGYTSAANSIGTLGYVWMSTPEIDIGEPDADTTEVFSHLHTQVVNWTVSTQLFAGSNGIARFSLVVPVQQAGGIVERKIEFEAQNIRGVCLAAANLNFSCEMLQQATLAMEDADVSDEQLASIVDGAPEDQQPA
jgi:hypothetical protein